MNIKEIQDLIKFVAKSGVTEVEIERKEFKITIKSEDKSAREAKTMIVQATTPAPVAIPVAAPVAAVPVAAAESEDDQYVKILSPMIGTFYRSAGPEKDSFVSVGDNFKVGDTVCIIEAMKLFNEIEAEITGRIVKVLVDDATPVEYDQPLFLVDPS
ncbi:MAG: acetyl-CoA carboxylase biotin carboxyl carrier protein [Flavobacteriaceae bacterium]|jgi:acetyl-CoA carboxylase biotin carboxyl carrier protein